MPIKTIQPFVSNFNAFAGEGFYGNVVQGLVIKQLEDAVFIFGIAIDGTLIFRKRNYPDVSTWEDPKIIIHSNNWHKIYSKPDLGGLIGTATASKNGLVPYYAGGVLSFQYGVKVSLGSIYRPFTCTISTYENAANTFIIAHINITGGSCAKALSRVGTVKIKYSASTKNIYIYNTTGDPIALQRLLNSVGKEVTGFSQISSEPTESDLVDIPINALWFTDWFKWRKFNGTEL